MAEKENYGSGVLHSSPELTLRDGNGSVFFSFFEKKRNAEEFKAIDDKGYAYVENPQSDEIKSLEYLFSAIDGLFKETNPDRGLEVKSAFLQVINTAPVQRLNRLSQLGLSKMPQSIAQSTFINSMESAWAAEKIIREKDIPPHVNEYLGGKRFQHVFKIMEVVARKCLNMVPYSWREQLIERIPPEFAINYLMGALLHDLGHPVLSHKGEMAISMALADEEVAKRTPEHIKNLAAMDHEQRAFHVIDNSNIRDILKKANFDVDLIHDIILEKKGGLQDADCAAYLSNDSANRPGDNSMVSINDSQIVSLVGTVEWNDILGDETISKEYWAEKTREKLLERRRNAYRDIYRQPDISRMEIQTGLGISMMVRDGLLSVEELLRGDDETINLKAKKIAESHGDKYKVFKVKDATEGILFPHVFSVPIEGLHADLQQTISYGLVSFQRKVEEILSLYETSAALKPEQWYVVLPYPYSQKKFKYGEKIIGKDFQKDATETNIMICFSTDVPDEIKDKLLRAISESAGVESEKKWLIHSKTDKVLLPLEDMEHVGKFSVARKEEIIQRDLYVWGENIGTEDESYLRLRHVYPNGSNSGQSEVKSKYKLSYKFAIPAAGRSSKLLHRGELEVDIPGELFIQFALDPKLLLTSDHPSLTKLISRFNHDHPDAAISPLGWVNNKRTKILLAYQGRQCEMAIDRLYFSTEQLDTKWTDLIKRYMEFELEIEQKNISEFDFLELLEYFNTLAIRQPAIFIANELSKLARMQKKFKEMSKEKSHWD